jgi:hypothetical protein
MRSDRGVHRVSHRRHHRCGWRAHRNPSRPQQTMNSQRSPLRFSLDADPSGASEPLQTVHGTCHYVSKLSGVGMRSQRAGVRWSVIVLSFVLLLADACSPTSPSSSSTCVSKGSLSARIDGVQWAATCVVIARVDPLGYVEINGTDNILDFVHAQHLSFTVFATQPGMYPLGGRALVGMGSSAALSIDCQPHPVLLCKAWGVAPCCGGAFDGGSGLITIADLTATRASGSFSFSLIAAPSGGATGTKVVTDGAFDVIF